MTAQTTKLRLVFDRLAPVHERRRTAAFRAAISSKPGSAVSGQERDDDRRRRAVNESVLSGKFDGSAAVWKDAERERTLLFSQPYLEPAHPCGRRGTDVAATTLEALKGKRIAIVEGYSYGETIDTSGPTFVRTKTEEEQPETAARRRSRLHADGRARRQVPRQQPRRAGANAAGFRFDAAPHPTVVSGHPKDLPDAASIITRFNAQLRSMIADHTYHRLLHVSFIRADVDGDGLVELVPASDSLGRVEPKDSYSLFSNTIAPPIPKSPTWPTNPNQRYMIGGSVYDGWTTVPDRYKVEDPKRPIRTRRPPDFPICVVRNWCRCCCSRLELILQLPPLLQHSPLGAARGDPELRRRVSIQHSALPKASSSPKTKPIERWIGL